MAERTCVDVSARPHRETRACKKVLSRQLTNICTSMLPWEQSPCGGWAEKPHRTRESGRAFRSRVIFTRGRSGFRNTHLRAFPLCPGSFFRSRSAFEPLGLLTGVADGQKNPCCRTENYCKCKAGLMQRVGNRAQLSQAFGHSRRFGGRNDPGAGNGDTCETCIPKRKRYASVGLKRFIPAFDAGRLASDMQDQAVRDDPEAKQQRLRFGERNVS